MDARRATALVSLGLIGAVIVGSIATAGDGDGSEQKPAAAAAVPDLPNRGPHPEFFEVQEWIQTDATSFDDFDGKVVAVQFWTFGCSNCTATFPHLRDL